MSRYGKTLSQSVGIAVFMVVILLGASPLSQVVLAASGGAIQPAASSSSGGQVDEVGFESAASDAFNKTWDRTDQLVASGQVNRTWMWGPKPNTGEITESYQQSPGGQRTVEYFDKSRMEITQPDGDPSSIWYVTNGLLAKELITGQMQVGDNQFEQRSPAEINVAGDANDPNGPTYATFNPLMGYGAIPSGWIITQTLNRAGTVSTDSSLSSYDVTAMDVGAPTSHNVASIFWDFMNSSGPVVQDGQTTTDKLFQNPFYATGYPLTEAYWTHVSVGGANKLVLVQVFERRVLTYTPDNPTGWQVEAGNVGQHYYEWRYTSAVLENVEQIITAATGGTISLGDAATVEIPAGGLTADAKVTLTAVSLPADSGILASYQASSGSSNPSGMAFPSIPLTNVDGQPAKINLTLAPVSGSSAQLKTAKATMHYVDLPPGYDYDLNESIYVPCTSSDGATHPVQADKLDTNSRIATWTIDPSCEGFGVAAYDWNGWQAAVNALLHGDLATFFKNIERESCNLEGSSLTINNGGGGGYIEGCAPSKGENQVQVWNLVGFPLDISSTPSRYVDNQLLARGNDLTISFPANLTDSVTIKSAVDAKTYVAIALEFALSWIKFSSEVDPVAIVNAPSNKPLLESLQSEGAKALLQAQLNPDESIFTIVNSAFYGNVGFWQDVIALEKAATKAPSALKALSTISAKSLAKSSLKLAKGIVNKTPVINLVQFDAEMISFDADVLLHGKVASITINPVTSTEPPSGGIILGHTYTINKYFFRDNVADLKLTTIYVGLDGTLEAHYQYKVKIDSTWYCPAGNPSQYTFMTLSDGTVWNPSSWQCSSGVQEWPEPAGATFDRWVRFPAIQESAEPFSITMIDENGVLTTITGIRLK